MYQFPNNSYPYSNMQWSCLSQKPKMSGLLLKTVTLSLSFQFFQNSQRPVLIFQVTLRCLWTFTQPEMNTHLQMKDRKVPCTVWGTKSATMKGCSCKKQHNAKPSRIPRGKQVPSFCGKLYIYFLQHLLSTAPQKEGKGGGEGKIGGKKNTALA